MAETNLDQGQAHRYFFVECFNKACDLIDKQEYLIAVLDSIQ
jgi:hypothetical protein